MNKTLKKLVESQKEGKPSLPYLRIINENFSDEKIELPNEVLLDLTFYRTICKESSLTNMQFYNGSFGSSFFKDSFFENCVFSNINFRAMESLNCTFKECLFRDCIFMESQISETTFKSCTFLEGSLDEAEFKSCHFLNTVFRNIGFGFAIAIDSKFSNSTEAAEFKEEVYLTRIADQLGKLGIWSFDCN